MLCCARAGAELSAQLASGRTSRVCGAGKGAQERTGREGEICFLHYQEDKRL